MQHLIIKIEQLIKNKWRDDAMENSKTESVNSYENYREEDRLSANHARKFGVYYNDKNIR